MGQIVDTMLAGVCSKEGGQLWQILATRRQQGGGVLGRNGSVLKKKHSTKYSSSTAKGRSLRRCEFCLVAMPAIGPLTAQSVGRCEGEDWPPALICPGN